MFVIEFIILMIREDDTRFVITTELVLLRFFLVEVSQGSPD